MFVFKLGLNEFQYAFGKIIVSVLDNCFKITASPVNCYTRNNVKLSIHYRYLNPDKQKFYYMLKRTVRGCRAAPLPLAGTWAAQALSKDLARGAEVSGGPGYPSPTKN